uniref:Uncharacterized protein n=1 Tax=Anthurium amnicola TaxID=1678845 RepID=A0A1D1ZH55_9ARAE
MLLARSPSLLPIGGMAAASSPVEVGARGTIGSLVSREIEYFKKLDLNRQESSQKPKIKTSPCINPRHKLGSRNPAAKKKVMGNGGFLPSICSVVEIADNVGTHRVPRIGYRNLKHDQDDH